MASTMRARSSGPAACATKASFTHTRTWGRKAGGREGRGERGRGREERRKSTQFELLVEDALLVRALDDGQWDEAIVTAEREWERIAARWYEDYLDAEIQRRNRREIEEAAAGEGRGRESGVAGAVQADV
jgi:hypothetical protein